MGLGLLPWERWLPPYVYGPLLFCGCIAVLIYQSSRAWWEWIVLPLGAVYGFLGTCAWIAYRANIFDLWSDG